MNDDLSRYAVRVHAVGGPEVLTWAQEPAPLPGPGEVQLRQTAIGLNFIDVYLRGGLYPTPLPFVPGQEGAGVVTRLGPGVEGLKVGTRVAYAGVLGAYATTRTLPAERLVPLPDGLSELTAAAVMLKGMTAEYLARRAHQVRPGETVVVHAAAGGVGQLLCQWARHLGATVVGVVGSEEKARVASGCGAEHVVVLPRQSLVDEVRRLTRGRGADVVYDSVGRSTLDASLDALRPRGLLVSFGQSSGLPAPVSLAALGGARSLFVTRPSLHAYIHSREELEASAAALFDVLALGVVRVTEPTRFPLADVAQAHRALEARQTTGAVVLVP
ncbi:MAG: quinone oxidoreductase [Myxococcaceae bacterium]|jgi:NADPH2:quinone reductase|nr:quinone oxidoreductase [Myxococcaceae bacterium]MCA3016110.1 quinone oxidoreductase [Myxococcaceae bacterium]